MRRNKTTRDDRTREDSTRDERTRGDKTHRATADDVARDRPHRIPIENNRFQSVDQTELSRKARQLVVCQIESLKLFQIRDLCRNFFDFVVSHVQHVNPPWHCVKVTHGRYAVASQEQLTQRC
jgi:hypothetical protein